MTRRPHAVLSAIVLTLAFGTPIATAQSSHLAAGGSRLLLRSAPRRGTRLRHMHSVAGSPAPLVFGIYPGGAAGAVGPSGQVIPEDPGKRLAALEQLRPAGQPFVVRLYASYTGSGGPTASQQLGGDVAQYTAAGFQVELVLAYRPADGGSAADVSGFTDFVRGTVDSFGPNRGLVSLQVTNEANALGAPNASDGYYGGARDALIQGVIAAKRAIRSGAFTQLRVGFNWAYAGGPDPGRFWRYLGRDGGATFVRALDWVGVDIYPGTWSQIAAGRSLQHGTALAIDSALRELRERYLPIAGIPAAVPLHISENGYPTGPDRTDQMQVLALRAAIAAVAAARAACNISNYSWFDLRDANSASSSFEDHYGLLNDDSTPKPAFDVYRQLVARLSLPQGAARRSAGPTRC